MVRKVSDNTACSCRRRYTYELLSQIISSVTTGVSRSKSSSHTQPPLGCLLACYRLTLGYTAQEDRRYCSRSAIWDMPPKAYAAEGSSPRSPISQMTTLPRSSKDRRQQQQQQQAVDFAHTHRGLVVREPSALLTRSLRSAITMGHPKDTPAPAPPAPPAQPSALAALPAEDPGDILLCDLGNKCLMVEDLENALRLWTRPAVLLAGRNSLDRLPVNIPGTILYLDLSWNRRV